MRVRARARFLFLFLSRTQKKQSNLTAIKTPYERKNEKKMWPPERSLAFLLTSNNKSKTKNRICTYSIIHKGVTFHTGKQIRGTTGGGRQQRAQGRETKSTQKKKKNDALERQVKSVLYYTGGREHLLKAYTLHLSRCR